MKRDKRKPTVASGRPKQNPESRTGSHPKDTTRGKKQARLLGPKTFDQLVEFTPVFQVLVDLYGHDAALAFGRVKRWTDASGVCFMSLDSMSKELRMGRKHLQACLHRLVDDGWLDAIREPGKTIQYRMPRALQASQGENDLPHRGQNRPDHLGRKGPNPQVGKDLGVRSESTYEERSKKESQERREERIPPAPAIPEDPRLQAAIREAKARGKTSPEAYARGMLRKGWTPPAGSVSAVPVKACPECGAPTPHHNRDCSVEESNE